MESQPKLCIWSLGYINRALRCARYLKKLFWCITLLFMLSKQATFTLWNIIYIFNFFAEEDGFWYSKFARIRDKSLKAAFCTVRELRLDGSEAAKDSLKPVDLMLVAST